KITKNKSHVHKRNQVCIWDKHFPTQIDVVQNQKCTTLE
ncbi:unnamed protein product, partial [Larinioides sclopetarius]